jgi:hypothetical protein
MEWFFFDVHEGSLFENSVLVFRFSVVRFRLDS